MRWRKLFALAAETLAHLLVELARIDELHFAFAIFRLAIGDDPHIGRDACVVEHVGGQTDDRFNEIVLEHVSTNLALARTCATSEERRAVEHDAEATSAFFRWSHL